MVVFSKFRKVIMGNKNEITFSVCIRLFEIIFPRFKIPGTEFNELNMLLNYLPLPPVQILNHQFKSSWILIHGFKISTGGR